MLELGRGIEIWCGRGVIGVGLIVEELDAEVCVVSGWKVVVGSEVSIGGRWVKDIINEGDTD